MLTGIALFLALGSGTDHAPEYPIVPVPLRELCEHADLIAVAVPQGEPEFYEGRDGPRQLPVDTPARLVIERTLLGEAPDEIAVHFEANMICPTPARFYAGKRTLVFLVQEDGEWRTVALSYGAKELDGDELQDYLGRIRAWQELEGIADPGQRFEATLEWLVRTIETRGTFGEGVMDLYPERTVPMAYGELEFEDFASHLTREQKDRLVNALLLRPADGFHELTLLDGLAGHRNPELAAFLARRIDVMIEDEDLWSYEVEDVAQSALALSQDPALQAWWNQHFEAVEDRDGELRIRERDYGAALDALPELAALLREFSQDR